MTWRSSRKYAINISSTNRGHWARRSFLFFAPFTKLFCCSSAPLHWRSKPTPRQTPTAALQRQLDAMATQHRGSVSLYTKNLKTGEMAQIDQTTWCRPRPSSSSPSSSKFSSDQGRQEKRSATRLPSSRKTAWSAPVSCNFCMLRSIDPRRRAGPHVIESDNTATNLMIDQVGLRNVEQAHRQPRPERHLPLQEGYKPAEGPNARLTRRPTAWARPLPGRWLPSWRASRNAKWATPSSAPR